VDDTNIKRILDAIKDGDCLAFLGAGACTPFVNHKGETIPGLPTGKQLAEKLAKQCQYSNGKNNDYDLLKVAEYFLYSFGGSRDALERAINEEIQKYCEPRPIHTALAQLNQVEVIITTNYDNLMEHELFRYGRILTKHIHHIHKSNTAHFYRDTKFKERDVVLLKMHGSAEEPGSMVIAESDYIHYLAFLHDKDRGMPDFFRKTMIPQRTLLFLGYGLADWTFRVIWEGVLAGETRQHNQKAAYSLVRTPTDMQKKIWARRNIDIIEMDLTDFSVKLAEHFNLAIPQLGIAKRPANIGGNL
jgi:hypothetical protein